MIELTTEEPQRGRANRWRLYWFHESDLDANYPATAETLVEAFRGNDAVRAEVLDGLGHREEVEQRVVASWKARAEDAEARILEYKSSEGHMREELRAAEAKVAGLTQERDDYRDGALVEERRCDELLAERNLARNETLAALEKVEELRAAYIASESRHATEASARFAAEQKVKELESELAFAGWHNLNEELLRRRNELYDDAALAEAKPPEPPIQPPPVPQVAEAMEAMEARRCGNAWHTDCDLRWTHCFPLNPESAPAQGGREKQAGTPLVGDEFRATTPSHWLTKAWRHHEASREARDIHDGSQLTQDDHAFIDLWHAVRELEERVAKGQT